MYLKHPLTKNLEVTNNSVIDHIIMKLKCLIVTLPELGILKIPLLVGGRDGDMKALTGMPGE